MLCLSVSHSYIATWSAADMMVDGVDQWHKKCIQLKK